MKKNNSKFPIIIRKESKLKNFICINMHLSWEGLSREKYHLLKDFFNIHKYTDLHEINIFKNTTKRRGMFLKKDPYPFNFILIYIVIKLLLLLTKLNIYAI